MPEEEKRGRGVKPGTKNRLGKFKPDELKKSRNFVNVSFRPEIAEPWKVLAKESGQSLAGWIVWQVNAKLAMDAEALARRAMSCSGPCCAGCGYPFGDDWLDEGETCPQCRLVN